MPPAPSSVTEPAIGGAEPARVRFSLGPKGARKAILGPSLRLVYSVMRSNPLTLVGFILVLLIVGTALAVSLVPIVSEAFLGHAVSILPYPPNDFNTAQLGQGPSAAHWFGTDNIGHDVFSRVLAALPVDLFIGFAVALFGLVVGGFLGLIAGFWDAPRTLSGVLSAGIMRVTDVFLSVPSLVLALAIAASLGRGTYTSMLAVMATWWPFYVRLTRGEVLVIKQQPYVMAARAAGVSDLRILNRHVLRNLIEPLAVYFTLDVGTVIVIYSTISFIGIGVPQNVPEWGNMIENYQDYLLTWPWTIGFVALAIFVTVLAFSLMGDGLRDILDPRSRRTLASSGVLTRPELSAGAV
jgi:peptide/nickel transport system permease protein